MLIALVSSLRGCEEHLQPAHHRRRGLRRAPGAPQRGPGTGLVGRPRRVQLLPGVQPRESSGQDGAGQAALQGRHGASAATRRWGSSSPGVSCIVSSTLTARSFFCLWHQAPSRQRWWCPSWGTNLAAFAWILEVFAPQAAWCPSCRGTAARGASTSSLPLRTPPGTTLGTIGWTLVIPLWDLCKILHMQTAPQRNKVNA